MKLLSGKFLVIGMLTMLANIALAETDKTLFSPNVDFLMLSAGNAESGSFLLVGLGLLGLILARRRSS